MLGQFGKNELYLLITAIISIVIIYRLKRRFSLAISTLFVLFGISVCIAFDFFLAAAPFDLFDILDVPKYEPFGVVYYFVFGPFSYFFVYIYDRLDIKGFYNTLYILGWSFVAVIVEGSMVLFDVLKYKGWKLIYSFPVYLFVQICTVLFFKYLKKNHINKPSS